MHVLNINWIFSTTYYTYDRCLEVWGKYGPDAWTLYTFYCKQSHIQNNKQSFTLNKFVREWLWWGDKRVKNARAVLKELWLIDDVVVRDEKWIIISHYVRVNYSIDEKDVRTAGMTYSLSTTAPGHDVVTGRCGWMDTNTLNITNKYPKQNTNTDVCAELTPDISQKIKQEETRNPKPRRVNYPADFELFWDVYPHNHCRKKDTYRLWQEYSDEERSQFLLWAKHECLYWDFIRHWETRMSQRCDRWMDSFVPPDEKEKLLETMKQVVSIRDEEVMNKAIAKAKEFFGEDKVRRALIKNTQRIVLDFH